MADGTVSIAQGSESATATLDATDGTQEVLRGGGGGSHPLLHYRRPTLSLPSKKPQIEITGRATTAQSAHSAATGSVAYIPTRGQATASAVQSSTAMGEVDNRRPINLQRARLLVALMKAA